MSTNYNDKPVLIFTDIVENETTIPTTTPTTTPTPWFKRWLKWFGYRTL